MAITPQTPGSIEPPISKTAESAGSVATPISKTAETAGSVATPIAKTAESAGSVVAPISKTAESAGSIATPISKTAESAGTVATPIAKTAETAGSVVAPIAKTAVGAAAFPRTFVPTLDLDFKNELYAQSGKPKEFDDLLTYSRASSATYLDRFMDSNGDWNYFINTDFVGSVTNLFSRSEQFDNAAWTKSNATIMANNTVDPLGGLTADKLEAGSTATIAPIVEQLITTVTSSVYSLSAFVKRSEASFVQIRFGTGDVANNPRVNFDLSTGVIGSQDADIDAASITPVGNDWYRISASFVAASTSTFFDFLLIKTASDARDQTNAWTQGEGLFIWGAQITLSTTLTPYVKTISTSASDTFSETLRIEYDAATGESLGALVESASTNLALRSEEFDNASWTKINSTVTANDTKGPDNSTSADKLKAGSTASIVPICNQAITSVATTSYTISAYVKRSEASFIQVYFGDAHVANNPLVNFNLATGVQESTSNDIDSASIIPVGNDWYRISATVEAAGTSLTVLIALMKSATDTRAQANAWTSGDGLFIWGAQIEQQAAPTSYIRTASATVSRLADLLSAPTSGNVPLGDVTFFADVDISENRKDIQYIYRVDAGSFDIFASFAVNGDLVIQNTTNAVTVKTGSSNFGKSLSMTSVLNRSASNTVGFLNGTQEVSSVLGNPINPNEAGVIGIGNVSPTGVQQLNGHIKQLTIFDKALTAQEVSLL